MQLGKTSRSYDNDRTYKKIQDTFGRHQIWGICVNWVVFCTSNLFCFFHIEWNWGIPSEKLHLILVSQKKWTIAATKIFDVFIKFEWFCTTTASSFNAKRICQFACYAWQQWGSLHCYSILNGIETNYFSCFLIGSKNHLQANAFTSIIVDFSSKRRK